MVEPVGIQTLRTIVEHHQARDVCDCCGKATPTAVDHPSEIDEAMGTARGRTCPSCKEPDALITVDACTAGVIVQVYDRLGERNRKRLCAMSLVAMANACWATIEKAGGKVTFTSR